jgi:hypothetical protein
MKVIVVEFYLIIDERKRFDKLIIDYHHDKAFAYNYLG